MAVDYDLRNERLERLAQIIDAESLAKELQEQADANYSSGGQRSARTEVSVKVRGDDRKFVRSFTREALAEALEVAETTVRSHVREVLARTGVARTDALAWRLLRICNELVAASYGVDHAEEDKGAPWGRGAGPSSHPQG